MKAVVARWRINENRLSISRADFTAYFMANEINPELVAGGLKKLYKATPSRLRIAAGVAGISSVQEYLIDIPVDKGSWLYDTMMEHSTRSDQSEAADASEPTA